MYITNEKATAIAQEIITTHAPRILKKLGLDTNNDGILDRIYVVAEALTEASPQAAIFNYVYTVMSSPYGINLSGTERYKTGSGTVTINAASAFYIHTKRNVFKEVKLARLFVTKKRLSKIFIYSLAHELRHYWQFITGEVWEKSARRGGINLMPYQFRWEEADANEFAREYLKEVKKDV